MPIFHKRSPISSPHRSTGNNRSRPSSEKFLKKAKATENKDSTTIFPRIFEQVQEVYFQVHKDSRISIQADQSRKRNRHPKLEEEQIETLRELINVVLGPKVLQIPKPELLYSLDTDASDYQIG